MKQSLRTKEVDVRECGEEEHPFDARREADQVQEETLSVVDMRQYLEFIADQRLTMLGLQKVYGAKNPFSFMDLQDVQELANFFERRVSAYQVAVAGEVSFSEAF